jgi:hypothetical protein
MMIDPELKKEFERLRKNQKNIVNGIKWIMVILLAIVVLVILNGSAHAQTLTITNSAGSSLRDINVYYPNATTGQMDLLGRYNTTSVITTDGDISYTLDMVPMESNPLTDPTDWMNNQAVPFVQSNIVGLIAIMFLVGLFYAGTRR